MLCAISPSLASRCPGLTSFKKPWALMVFPLAFSQGYSHFFLSSPSHLCVSLGLEQESPGTEVGSLHTLSNAFDHLASSLSLLAKNMWAPVSLVFLMWWPGSSDRQMGCFLSELLQTHSTVFRCGIETSMGGFGEYSLHLFRRA